MIQTIVHVSLIFIVLLSSVVHAEVVIEQGYVVEPLPGRHMSAAYMEVSNLGHQNITLTSACAEWAGAIEIHTHIHEQGVMKMRPLESVVIPAGETMSFRPGGHHLMLFRLDMPLESSLSLNLCFKEIDCQTIELPLKSRLELE